MQATRGAKKVTNVQGTNYNYRRTLVVARTRADSLSAQPQRLFQQHKVLLQVGFSYDQAALILQVSEHQKLDFKSVNSSEHVGPACDQQGAEVTPLRASSARLVTTQDSTAVDSPLTADSTCPQTPVTSAELQALQSRISFLELELLKQSLCTSPQGPVTLPDPNSSSNKQPRRVSLRGISQELNSTTAADAGVRGLRTAAAKNNQHAWWAMSQKFPEPIPSNTVPIAEFPPDISTATMQLAAAAELGHLDPDVYAIAEALAVRKGPEVTPPPSGAQATLSPGHSLTASWAQQQQQSHGSIWGRTLYTSRPLAARAWDAPLYKGGEEGLDLRPGENAGEDVPYTPSGWAVAGTIMFIYLGVLATFLALCVSDAPY